MYAIIEVGGRQVRVAKGDVVKVDKLDAAVGDKVNLGRVLALADGETLLTGDAAGGARVVGTVRAQGRARRILVFKQKRRKGYRRTKGHRQPQTTVVIEDIAR